MSARSTWTSVQVRAEDLVRGEVVQIGGLAFTRLKHGGPLTKAAVQKPRYVEALGVGFKYAEVTARQRDTDRLDVEWVEVMFRGGDCPANSRIMFSLFRPYELVRVQVEKVN